MKNLALLIFLTSSAAIAGPSSSLFESCASGKAQPGVDMAEIPMNDLSQVEYRSGFVATVTKFKKKEIGIAQRGEEQGVIFNKNIYLTRDSTLVNISANEFNEMILYSGVDLAQTLDWYSMRDRNKKRYICVALNRSMERAIPLVFALETWKPKGLYFYVGNRKSN